MREVKDDYLYLHQIVSDQISMNQLFSSSAPVLASWYTGELCLLKGYSVDFHGVTSYDSKIDLTFMAGRLIFV